MSEPSNPWAGIPVGDVSPTIVESADEKTAGLNHGYVATPSLELEQDEEVAANAMPPESGVTEVGGEREKGSTEEVEDKYYREEWAKEEKHFFILSNAGKPIFSRFYHYFDSP